MKWMTTTDTAFSALSPKGHTHAGFHHPVRPHVVRI
jgi:hypothetical protein